MRSDVISLITVTRTQNAIGEWVPSEKSTQVYAGVDSITRNEWYEAGQLGLKPSYRFTIHMGDYGGQELLEYNGERYGVYRTYNTYDRIELYAERKAGL